MNHLPTLFAALLTSPALLAAPAACQAQSSATPPLVVELYTSKGCSWPDRFAGSDFTQRQYAQARRDGSAQVYTPQVVVQGRDWRGWPKLPPVAAVAAVPAVTLKREGDAVTATVQPLATRSGAQLSAYWAVLEDGHQTAVRAGENAGEQLRHNHVVRRLLPVPAWAAASGTATTLSVTRGDPAFPRRVVLVVTDGATRRPLQTVALGC